MKKIKYPLKLLFCLVILAVAAFVCYVPVFMSHAAHSVSVLEPVGDGPANVWASWDAMLNHWAEDVQAVKDSANVLDLRGEAEKAYDTLSSHSVSVFGMAGPYLESFSDSAMELLAKCQWCWDSLRSEKVEPWLDFCLYTSFIWLLIVLAGGILLSIILHRLTSIARAVAVAQKHVAPAWAAASVFVPIVNLFAPARLMWESWWAIGVEGRRASSKLFVVWGVCLALFILFVGNTLLCSIAQLGVILPYWGVLIGGVAVVVFMVSSFLLFRRMSRALNNPAI